MPAGKEIFLKKFLPPVFTLMSGRARRVCQPPAYQTPIISILGALSWLAGPSGIGPTAYQFNTPTSSSVGWSQLLRYMQGSGNREVRRIAQCCLGEPPSASVCTPVVAPAHTMLGHLIVHIFHGEGFLKPEA